MFTWYWWNHGISTAIPIFLNDLEAPRWLPTITSSNAFCFQIMLWWPTLCLCQDTAALWHVDAKCPFLRHQKVQFSWRRVSLRSCLPDILKWQEASTLHSIVRKTIRQNISRGSSLHWTSLLPDVCHHLDLLALWRLVLNAHIIIGSLWWHPPFVKEFTFSILL